MDAPLPGPLLVLELGTELVTVDAPAVARKEPFCCGLLPFLLIEGELAKLSLL